MRLPFIDSLTNYVANLGTTRDKAAQSSYVTNLLSDQQLSDMYRTSWLARKIIDIIPLDATRHWRAWQAENDNIEAIEALEDKLGVRNKVREALTKARLFGGAALYIGTRDLDPSKPLDPARIGLGGLLYVAVIPRQQLSATELETDATSDRYGLPKAYRLSNGSGMQEIHPSRLVLFVGAALPDNWLATGAEYGWGDSVLTATLDAIKQADATLANVASMVFESKVDVVKIPGFMEQLGDKEYQKRVQERLQLAAIAKGVNGMLVLDGEEDYETKQLGFGNLPELMDRFLQIVSGAADIPATRLLGQSPAGLAATGESDTRNYYDRVRATQELDIGPAMQLLDECLIRSALGNRPPEVHYEWASLWQTTPEQKAAIGKTIADTIVALNNTKLWPLDVMSQTATTMLVEHGCATGLESAMKEYEGDSENDMEPEEANNATGI